MISWWLILQLLEVTRWRDCHFVRRLACIFIEFLWYLRFPTWHKSSLSIELGNVSQLNSCWVDSIGGVEVMLRFKCAPYGRTVDEDVQSRHLFSSLCRWKPVGTSAAQLYYSRNCVKLTFMSLNIHTCVFTCFVLAWLKFQRAKRSTESAIPARCHEQNFWSIPEKSTKMRCSRKISQKLPKYFCFGRPN